MSLATRVRIASPLPVEDVWNHCREMLGAGDDVGFDREPCRYRDGVEVYRNYPDQGLLAWLSVSYGVDGPLTGWGDEDEMVEVPPPACIEVDFDTAYGYRGQDGSGCNDLHRRLTAALGDWLDERGATEWWAQHEYDGTWHHRTPCPIEGRP